MHNQKEADQTQDFYCLQEALILKHRITSMGGFL